MKPFEFISWQDQQIEVRRRPRLRRLSLTVTPQGGIYLRAAYSIQAAALQAFVHNNETWLKKQLKKVKLRREQIPTFQYVDRERFPLLGQLLTLRIKEVTSQHSHLTLKGQELIFERGLKPIDTRQLIREFYKKSAYKYFPLRLQLHSEKMQLAIKKLRIACQKSVWGSCSSQGVISLNWRLMAAPVEVIDYVMIHELCHLQHANHSKGFWNLVSNFDVNYQQHRYWLRENGNQLDFLI